MATGTEVFPFQTTIPVRKLKKPSLFGCCVTPQDASQADANFSVKSVEQGKGCRLAIGAEALIYMPKEKVGRVSQLWCLYLAVTKLMCDREVSDKRSCPKCFQVPVGGKPVHPT